MQPKVLIICERAAERDTIRVLVGTMGCQWVLASGIEEALTLLGRERTSAALLELPGVISDPAKLEEGVRELLVRFPGRIIVLTDGAPGPLTNELISKYSIPSVQRGRLAVDLWPRLESMVYPQLGSRRITRVARLVLDTFLQPLPAGIRDLQPDTRQLVYEAPALAADISFELSPNSPRITLLGQVLRTKEPQIPLNGVSVVLKSRNGPLSVKMTNEVGEFSFEFQDERTVSLEIEVSPNEWVLLITPPLDWAGNAKDQAMSGSGISNGLTTNDTKLPGKKVRLV
jgi:hypothetical protein